MFYLTNVKKSTTSLSLFAGRTVVFHLIVRVLRFLYGRISQTSQVYAYTIRKCPISAKQKRTLLKIKAKSFVGIRTDNPKTIRCTWVYHLTTIFSKASCQNWKQSFGDLQNKTNNDVDLNTSANIQIHVYRENKESVFWNQVYQTRIQERLLKWRLCQVIQHALWKRSVVKLDI